MSYCGNEDTLKGLEDCYENMDNKDLSESEENCREKLIKLAITIAIEYGDEINDPVIRAGGGCC